ncbi:alkanesulfonate monooxygenase SsuD/methylene tetrahydromethanopterin reductase-like flavin-dependent oxidoreductase (luciferase family) [Microbacterium terrae]|uniref:Phthiodiolone/phenolphthiodiolone dimycocerosates ketoreductase n=1 Tax=Microbacterium terrae TaxID=69369 RepID=A0A0M2H4A9_9MICO|nr:LLM class flavin-dependent oxidoreductase [Microbacterium terrae]KJL39261.1 Phthiodiolone/phenolphthiodiolone dimycocerosates ketoreductase [Microbacterium terrae]MBP1076805.1 alkanesulfonate monooxygenase SsuD/methylene tetrahydromethanopterin reductase-like flavin-dependent oxidoreductase (luciferase family) [Microbacterium terrae]GLJ99399.1 oxidoreductase [Microbacterium terrae]
MARIGAIFNPYTHDLDEFPDAVAAAERSGVDELWIWEDCFRHSAFAAASAALAWTERLRIGIGIAPLPMRNAAATAMEIATIEQLFPGRLLPGLGHGVLPWMGQIGARAASPLTLMREYVPAVRALLSGDEVSTSGRYVTLDGVQLVWPPASAPAVYAAAEGPKTLALSGEVADGTVLNSGYTPDEVAGFTASVRGARSDAGRGGRHDIVAYVVAAFGADAEARVSADLSEKPDPLERAIWGEPAHVAAGARRYFAAGVDDVVLLPASRVDLAEFYDAAGEVTRLLAAG